MAGVAAALLMLIAALPAAALSLGTPEILSSLGEPLRLDVTIESDRSSGGMPVARLINADGSEAWAVAGVAGAIRLDIVALDDVHQRLQIRSSLPVWEPLLMLRVEVSQATMRIVRELPVLLDPPSTEAPVAAGVAGTADESAAIDTRIALTSTPPPIEAAQAAETTPAPREKPARNKPRAAEPADFTLPAPRFQLAAALSTYSLAWLRDNPEPVAATAEIGSDSAVDEEPVETAEESTAPSTARAPLPEERTVVKPAEKPQSAPLAAIPPRGLPMGSPWLVLLIMLAVTVGLFAYARRMRRSMMSDGELMA